MTNDDDSQENPGTKPGTLLLWAGLLAVGGIARGYLKAKIDTEADVAPKSVKKHASPKPEPNTLECGCVDRGQMQFACRNPYCSSKYCENCGGGWGGYCSRRCIDDDEDDD